MSEGREESSDDRVKIITLTNNLLLVPPHRSWETR